MTAARIGARRLVRKVEAIAYHRNGICGAPFWVVRFVGSCEKGHRERFIATVFAEPRGACAVLSLEKLAADGDIAFGSNSWRGDHFEPELRAACEAWEAAP